MAEANLNESGMQRRALLGLAAAAAALPRAAFGQESEDSRLRATLDAIAKLDAPWREIDRLTAIQANRLSPSARIDLVTVRTGLTIDRELATRFAFGRLGRSPYLVSPLSGAWRDAGRAGSGLVERLGSENAELRAAAARGVVLPRPLLEATRAAIDRTTPASAAVADALSAQSRLLAELGATAPAEPGVSRFAGGRDYYALLLRRHSGMVITPEAAHAILTRAAQRIGTRTDALLRTLGWTSGSVGKRMRDAFRDSRFLYEDDASGRDRAVSDMNDWLARARARLPSLFDPLPAQCLDVRVRSLSAQEEADGKQGFRTLPGPGMPGAYIVDLRRIRERPSWTLGAVVHHELLPGHMIQSPIEAQTAPHPLRMEYLPAFAEGWAIYAEELMADDGAFAADPRALLGQLHWLLFRVVRGLVDTGVHIERWSRQEASTKLAQLQGEAAYFAPIEADLDRICVEPALRAAEALVWLDLTRRGRKARRSGASALKAFHRAVLAHGRKPLAMIE